MWTTLIPMPPYSLDYTHSTLGEVIDYMTARMKRLGFAVPEEGAG